MDPNICVEHAETFWDLFRSPAHWYFEVFLEIISGIFAVAVWPFICKSWKAGLKRWLHRHDRCCSPQSDHG